jgi:hypothetical protein
VSLTFSKETNGNESDDGGGHVCVREDKMPRRGGSSRGKGDKRLTPEPKRESREDKAMGGRDRIEGRDVRCQRATPRPHCCAS